MTPEEMKNLSIGDTVHFACGGKANIAYITRTTWTMLPYRMTFVGSSQEVTYGDSGNYYIDHESPFDITRITKAVQIPEGFIPWHGGECPVDGETKVECFFKDDSRGIGGAKGFGWNGEFRPVAYRIVPPKQSGELWAVVRKSSRASHSNFLSHHLSRADACGYAVCMRHEGDKILAIFNPFTTGGKWVEGDGLELLND